MDDETRTLIEETHEMAQENQKRIKKIQSHLRRKVLGSILYKVVIIAIAVGAFYFLKPYYENLKERLHTMTEKVDTIQGYVDEPSSLLPDEFNLFKGLIPN